MTLKSGVARERGSTGLLGQVLAILAREAGGLGQEVWSLAAVTLSLVVFVGTRSAIKRRTAACEAVTEDVVGLLGGGRTEQAAAVLTEAEGPFAIEARALLEGVSARLSPLSATAAMAAEWGTRALLLATAWVAGCFSGVAFLSACDQTGGWHTGATLDSDKVCLGVLALVPCVLAAMLHRHLDKLCGRGESRRLECLQRI